jgi:23S rRNA (cytosine1962-C5)-methyltransferase
MADQSSAGPEGPKKKPRLRLRLTAAAETAIRSRHPWVYADSVRDQNRPGDLGELAVIFDRKDAFLAVGLFDPDSPLRVRILHAGKPKDLSPVWWEDHLRAALDRRESLFDSSTTGHRWIHGESDGWPGLVLDRYAGTLVLKIYTGAWLPRLRDIVQLLLQQLQPERLVLRLSRNIQQVAATFQFQDGQVLHGSVPDKPVVFVESGLAFEADVIRGQKTGFFLDQRENRRRVGSLARGRRVLNAFSFSGGFSLYAAQGGASEVTDLDISAHALDSAQRNFQLNTNQPGVSSCRRTAVQADTFEWLEQPGQAYDLIILDPPALAKKAAERAGALNAYSRLVRLGLKRLAPGGILVTCSCSAQVSKEEFFSTVLSAARGSGRTLKELHRALHPPDHPAGFPEAEYLKAIYLQS